MIRYNIFTIMYVLRSEIYYTKKLQLKNIIMTFFIKLSYTLFSLALLFENGNTLIFDLIDNGRDDEFKLKLQIVS